MATPFDNITDGYVFQQIVTEYFESLRGEKHDYHIADIVVDDNGVGTDGGFDITVYFHYVDVISRHSVKWIVECKCWNESNSLSLSHIDTNNIISLLRAKKAQGYLLVCKGSATDKLKTRFKELSAEGNMQFKIWEGVPFWHKVVKRKSILEAYFPDYYKHYFLENNSELDYDKIYKELEQRLKK